MKVGRFAATITAGLCILALTACARATPTSDLEPSNLLRVLERTPASLKDPGMVFGDLGRALDLAGAPSLQECENADEQGQEACIEAVRGVAATSGTLLKSTSESARWQQAFGFSRYDATLVVSTATDVLFGSTVEPSYLEGRFDESAIRQKLLEQGYAENQFVGYTYYAKWDDYWVGLNDPLSRLTLGTMNRVYVGDGVLVTAPATAHVEAFLETWAGNRSSLADDEAFSSLARALDDPLSAVLLTKDAVWEPVQDDLATYEKPPGWSELHQWEALGVGYGKTSDDGPWYRFSVYYEDPKAAGADAGELVKRMQSYRTSSLQREELSGQTNVFEQVCSSWDSQVREDAIGSTLTVQCDLKEGVGGMTWLILVEMRELMFLVP